MERSERDRKKLERNAAEDIDFSKAVDECVRKGFNVDKALKIGTTPFCLRIAGAEAIPLMILGRDLRNCVSGEKASKHNKHEHTEKHSISIKTVKKFPEALRNPMCICTGNRPNSLLVISDLLDQNGENIVFPIYLSVKGLNNNINRIQTVYGKKNIQAFILRMEQENKLIAVNKEKIDKCFVNRSNATIELQLPKVENIINLDNSIAYSLANVKYPEEKNLQENQKNKGDVKPMTEQQMLAQIEALRKEFEGKFTAMEEKFNNLSSEVQTINKFVAAMTEAQGFEQTMSEIESVTKQLTACENAVFYCYDNGADKFFSGSDDERNYEQAADNIRAAFDSGDIISSGQAAVIPLVSAKGETLGVIAAEKEGGFTAADYDYFKSGSQIVSTVELALNKEFEHQGRVTDELTGLKNRQGLNEYVADTVRRNINADKPVNIVMCDIDHFKNINDTYGHDAGDTVLKNVAKILQDGTRSGDDCAFRMGGEEMVLMLGCEPEKAAEIAERLRVEVESAVHTVMQDGQEKEISVTISMGIHTMKPETEMTKENARAVFDSEFKFADDLVYEAKESGRNRVVTDISETVIELDGYISDDIPVYDIDRNEDIKTPPETANDSIRADSSVQENITFEGLNEAYNDFLYSSKIFNDVHISFIDEHGELPPDLSTAENRTAVSEYINNQLDSGNITAEQREELTNLRQKIRDFEEPLFCEVVDEIMEQAAEISEISQETREQETEKSKGNER